MHSGKEVIIAALAQPVSGADMSLTEAVEQAKAARSKSRTGPYKHLMTGVSYMLPVVIAGGLAIALAFAIGGIYAGDQKGTLGRRLEHDRRRRRHSTCSSLFFPASSPILDCGSSGDRARACRRHARAKAGRGFSRRYRFRVPRRLPDKVSRRKIKLPATLEGLKPVLILPFLSTITVGLLMIFVIAPPVAGPQHRDEHLAQRHARRERGLPRRSSSGR